jgi:hypothetical protein
MPEKQMSPQLARYYAKRDEILEQQKAYRDANKSACQERVRKWYTKNKKTPALKEKQRAYYRRRKAAGVKPKPTTSEQKVAQRAYKREYHKRNYSDPAKREKAKAQSRAWLSAKRRDDPEYLRALARRWAKKNRAKIAAWSMRRHASKLRATPAWADHKAIEDVYALAEMMTGLLGRPYQVDHIVPLRSRLVSGLHVSNNLQVISAEENNLKSNKVWPEMPN